MIVVQSFDFIHAVFAEVNSDGPDDGQLLATFMLAIMFWPIFPASFPAEEISKYKAMIHLLPEFLLAFLLAFIYAQLRKNHIRSTRARLPRPIPTKTRVVALIFFMANLVGSAVAVHHSQVLTVSVLVAIACLPWQAWAGLQRAP